MMKAEALLRDMETKANDMKEVAQGLKRMLDSGQLLEGPPAKKARFDGTSHEVSREISLGVYFLTF